MIIKTIILQFGPKPLSFRWRGRNSTTDIELNPKVINPSSNNND